MCLDLPSDCVGQEWSVVRSEMLIPKIVDWTFSTHWRSYNHVPGDLQVHQTQPTSSFRSSQLYRASHYSVFMESLTALIKPGRFFSLGFVSITYLLLSALGNIYFIQRSTKHMAVHRSAKLFRGNYPAKRWLKVVISFTL